MYTTVRINSEPVRRLRQIVSGLCRPARSWGIIWLLAITVCTVLGCREGATTGSAEARSPDGHWVAIALSKQYGGPGTAGRYTSVYLRRTDIRQLRLKFWGSLLGSWRPNPAP